MIGRVSLNQFQNVMDNSYLNLKIKSLNTEIPANITGIIGNRMIFGSDKGTGSVDFKGKLLDYSISFNSCELNKNRNFAINNSYVLKWLMTGRISIDDFLNVMIKGGDKASEREIELQKEAVDRIVFGD
jgi:hypothetical protein